VRSLLTHGAELNHHDNTGRTALHSFFNETIRALIEFHHEDIDLDSHDSYGMNVAHWVCRSKSSLPIDLQRVHKTSSALLERKDEHGRTPLHYACQRGNIQIIETLLLEKNSAFSPEDNKGRTLMHYATESGRSAQIVDILVREGFDIHAVDDHGRTVLHHAAAAGNVNAVEKLLHLGVEADLDAVDKENRTPIQLAAWCSTFAVVDVLRAHYVNVQDSELFDQQSCVLASRTSLAERKENFILPSFYLRITVELLCVFALLGIAVQLWVTSKSKM
jgi:ankyrin repeat protein